MSAALVVVVALAALPSAAAASVTDRVDMANTGSFPDEELVPPLVERWSIPANVETLLAADGRVYVTDSNGAVAFDLATGRQLWARGFTLPSSTSYDRGVLYVRTETSLAAVDAATGAFRWERPARREWRRFAPAVTAGELVFFAANGVITAVRAADGAEVWSQRPMGDATPGLATDGQRLYAGGSCGDLMALDPATGALLWQHDTPRCGGGDARVAIHGGRVYHPEEERVSPAVEGPARPIFDAASGALLRHTTAWLPMFVDGLVVARDRAELRADDAATGETRWRRPSLFLQAMIAIGHDVYGLEGRRLTALSVEDGNVLWTHDLSDDVFRGTEPLSAAAPGTLLTFAGGRLTAWESFFKPAPHAVALGAGESDVKAGESVSLTGVLGRDLRGVGVPVRIDGATWRGDFERFADLRAARDGGFTTSAVVYRNSRFRVSAPGAGSEAVTVYANPTVVLGAPSGGSVGVSVRAPRSRLAGRTLFLYRDPRGDGRLRRLASGTLRATAPGRTRTRLALRNRRGELVFCIRGQLKLGLGRPDALNRRCGARRIAS